MWPIPNPYDIVYSQRNAAGNGFEEKILTPTPNSFVIVDPCGELTTLHETSSYFNVTASYAILSGTSSFTTTANYANSASQATSASYAEYASAVNLSQSYITSVTGSTQPPFQPATLWWDDNAKTYALYSDHPGVSLQLGQDQWIRAYADETIINGSAVYITGSLNGLAKIRLAIADAQLYTVASQVIGLATETISSGSVGIVTSHGQVHDLDTSAFIPGELIYLSNANSGSWSSVPPPNPYQNVAIGYIISAHSGSGIVQVNVSNFGAAAYSFVGMTTTPSITSTGGGGFSVGSGRCNLCTTSDGYGYVRNFSVPSANLTINTSSVLDAQYVIVAYNSGSPEYRVVTDKTSIDDVQTTIVYTITPGAGGAISQVNHYDPGVLLANKLLTRISNVQGIERESGVLLTESGSKGIVITAGVAWNGVSELSLSAVNSSGSRFVLLSHSASAWSASLISSFDNDRCDDGINLQPLDNNRWVVNYVYRGIGNLNTSIVMLSDQYDNLIDCQNSYPPPVPTEFPNITFLVGRAIYRQGDLTATQIDSAYTNNFSAYPAFVGTNGYYPKWASNTLSSTSSLYEAANRHILINSVTHPNPSFPETLLVNQIDSSSVNITTFQADVNNYTQINVRNLNTGVSASSDVVATADNGDEDTWYIDMGIGGSAYDDPRWSIFKENDGYLYVNGGDLIVGTDTAGKKIEFFTDGAQTGNVRAYIDSTGIHASGSVDTASYLNPGATLFIVSGSNGISPAYLEPYDYSPVDTIYLPPYKAGRVFWDNRYNDWAFYPSKSASDSAFRFHLGKEITIGVHNPYATTLPRLSVVYISGSLSNAYQPNVYLAQADGTGTKSNVLGVIRNDIPSGSIGFCLLYGSMHRTDMSAYGEAGTKLWLSTTTPGGMTSTKPGQPNEVVEIGYVSEAGSLGSFICIPFKEPAPSNAFAGITSEITSSNKNDGTIVFTTGSVNLYDNPEGTGAITQFLLPQTTLTLVTGSTNYVVAEKSGSVAAQYTLTTDAAYANGINRVRVATLDIYTGDPPGSQWDVHEFDVGIDGLALANRLNNKDIRLYGYQRESGLTLYTTGSDGHFGITEGTIWYGPNSHTIPTYDTTLPGYYAYLFHTTSSSGTSSWAQHTSSIFFSGYYDSGSGIAACAQLSWSVNFVYRLIGTEDEAAIVLSSNQFATALEASNNAVPPADLPSTIRDIGLLVGRFIIQSGSMTPTIESAFSNLFAAATVTQHESLLGLQGGQGGEHYHLTLDDYNGTGTGLVVRSSNAMLNSPTFVAATPYHIPYWDINQKLTLTGSVQVQDGQYVTINSASFPDPLNPDALLVKQVNPLSANTIGAYSDINGFSQIYNQNFNTGALASSDIVATADIGSQDSNFIDMGIASSTFNNPTWPWNGPFEGYLMMNGGTLWVGTTTDHKIKFFINNTASVGYFDQTGAHITGSLIGTASWASFWDSGSIVSILDNKQWTIATGSVLPVTASFAFSASYAPDNGQNNLVTGSTYPITASRAITASYVVGIPTIKSGVVSGSAFGGNPKTSSIVFVKAFPDNNYSVTVTGEPSRTWTVQNKGSTGFQVNANNNTAFSGFVFWQAISTGEFYNT